MLISIASLYSCCMMGSGSSSWKSAAREGRGEGGCEGGAESLLPQGDDPGGRRKKRRNSYSANHLTGCRAPTAAHPNGTPVHRTSLHVHQHFGRHRDVAPPCLVHLRRGEDWRTLLHQGSTAHHAKRLQGSRQEWKRVEVVCSSHDTTHIRAHTPTLKIWHFFKPLTWPQEPRPRKRCISICSQGTSQSTMLGGMGTLLPLLLPRRRMGGGPHEDRGPRTVRALLIRDSSWSSMGSWPELQWRRRRCLHSVVAGEEKYALARRWG